MTLSVFQDTEFNSILWSSELPNVELGAYDKDPENCFVVKDALSSAH